MKIQAPTLVRVERSHAAWTVPGATAWLVRQLRFNLELPWTRVVPYQRPRVYPMGREDAEFLHMEMDRRRQKVFVRQGTPRKVQAFMRSGMVFPASVTQSAGKSRLVVEQKNANECTEASTFRRDQILDLASALRRGDHMFYAERKEPHYHLRLRETDGMWLFFFVGGVIYVPLCLNCGLAVAPWFFTKTMLPWGLLAACLPPHLLVPGRFL